MTDSAVHTHKAEQTAIAVATGSASSHSTESVKIFLIKRHVILNLSLQRELSGQVRAINEPFYCKGDFIYKRDSNTWRARLPANVLTIDNSVTYNEKS